MASADLQEAFLSKQLPATADAIHDLSSNVTMQESAKVGKALQDAHKEKKYSKEILSDRNHERLSLLLQSDTEDGQQTVAKALEEDHRKRFQRYKHHYFEYHWKPRSSSA
ncbi:putative Heterokaryon incompatibility protein (HET) domain-containing protein [Seiridium cardinale]